MTEFVAGKVLVAETMKKYSCSEEDAVHKLFCMYVGDKHAVVLFDIVGEKREVSAGKS